MIFLVKGERVNLFWSETAKNGSIIFPCTLICIFQDDEDKEDVNIKPADNLIVVGKVEDELSNLEIYGKVTATVNA